MSAHSAVKGLKVFKKLLNLKIDCSHRDLIWLGSVSWQKIPFEILSFFVVNDSTFGIPKTNVVPLKSLLLCHFISCDCNCLFFFQSPLGCRKKTSQNQYILSQTTIRFSTICSGHYMVSAVR